MAVNESLHLSSRTSGSARHVLAGSECLAAPPEALRHGDGFRLDGADGSSFCLTQDMLATGLMLLGSTGCGKSNVLGGLLDKIIPGMTEEDVMIILDSKGDYRARYYQPGNPRHILFSLREEDRSESAVWNIYRELTNRQGRFSMQSLGQNAWKISQALFRGMESSSQPFFSMGASDILAKLLCAVVRSPNASQLMNTAALNALLSGDPQSIFDRLQPYPEYRYLNAYVGNHTSHQALGIWGYLMCVKARSIEPLDIRGRGGSLGIREFLRNKGGKILFLEYDVEYADTLEVLYSLFYDLAIQEALTVEGGSKYFICDEASLLPYIKNLPHLTNLGRSYGCRTVFAMQSYSMLRSHYSEAQAEAIAAGFCNLIAFRNTDAATRNYVKQRLGETFDVYSYGGANVTHPSYTVTDATLRGLPVGQGIVDCKGQPVFSFRFAEYR